MLNVNTLWIMGGVLIALCALLGLLLRWLINQADETNTWRSIGVSIYHETGDFPKYDWIECAESGQIYHVIINNPKNMPTPDVVRAIKVQAKKEGFKIKAIGIKGVAIA